MNKKVIAMLSFASITAPQSAYAFEEGDIILRVGTSNVSPEDSSSNIFVGGNDLGVNLAVESDTQLGLNLAYFITNKLNVEVLASTPFKHDVNFGADDPLGTGNNLGEVTHLPPTITLNYYLNTSSSQFQPYIGAGVNYTLFFDEEFNSTNQEAGLNDLALEDSFGLTAQIGVDYLFDQNWFGNASIRWIDIDTKASFNLDGTNGFVSKIEIDPWVYTVSIGYTF